MIEDSQTDGSEENFAELFEQSIKKQVRLEPGQMVEAVIVSITADWIFLGLGGKGEGYLDRKELQDEQGGLTVREGDRIRAYFLSSKNNELHFTTKIGSGPGKHSQLEDAWRNRVPVEGTAVKEVKGGFEVRLGGGVRAFCPFSLTGMRRGEPQTGFVGKALTFQIIEYGEDGRNIVVSRRAVLDEQKRSQKDSLRNTLKEGQKVPGVVTSLQNFGAFVDIGGVEGLLPVSEIAWSRTERPADVLSVGQRVEVVIKKLDWENDRFSFSLKETLPDPWDRVAELCPPGSFQTGTVARLAPFGAFVTLAAGVDGLIHISKLGGDKRISHPREVLKEGQSVEVKIEAVDRGNRKISLSLAEISRAEEEAASALRDYQRSSDAAQNMGSLGDELKKKMEEKGK